MSKTNPLVDSFPPTYALSLRNSSHNIGVREMQRLQKQSWKKKTNAYKINCRTNKKH